MSAFDVALHFREHLREHAAPSRVYSDHRARTQREVGSLPVIPAALGTHFVRDPAFLASSEQVAHGTHAER